MKIRLCEHNQGARQLLQRLSGECPELDIKLKSCVKQCKKCKQLPFALVNKQVIKSNSHDELYTILLSMISEKTGL